MQRLLGLGLLVVVASCAPPLTRPAPVPAPSPLSEVVQMGGPEGESPAPSGLGGTVSRAPADAVATPAASAVPAVTTAAMKRAIDRLKDHHLLVPVAGAKPGQIEDSFTAQRDDGARTHHAVDILAPRNTPILAADDGTILRLSTNTLGGITIYAQDADAEYVYYYAHLDHYRDGIEAGQKIAKGDTLGFVGTTGNAPKDIPHLHFQIMRMPDDGKYWNGEPINPYPFLHVDEPKAKSRGKGTP